jgi:hypothetical protein
MVSCATLAVMVEGEVAGSVAEQPGGMGPLTHTASPWSSNCQSLRVSGGDPFAIVGVE